MGDIRTQDEGDQQLVTFIFNGKLEQSQVDEWNRQIRQLREMFGNKVRGVTLKGERPPAPRTQRGRTRKR